MPHVVCNFLDKWILVGRALLMRLLANTFKHPVVFFSVSDLMHCITRHKTDHFCFLLVDRIFSRLYMKMESLSKSIPLHKSERMLKSHWWKKRKRMDQSNRPARGILCEWWLIYHTLAQLKVIMSHGIPASSSEIVDYRGEEVPSQAN